MIDDCILSIFNRETSGHKKVQRNSILGSLGFQRIRQNPSFDIKPLFFIEECGEISSVCHYLRCG